MAEDFRVRAEYFEFAVDGNLAVDESACRAFLVTFASNHKTTDLETLCARLQTDFGAWFGCGVLAGATWVSGTKVFVTIGWIGTENTGPARRPRGPEPEP